MWWILTSQGGLLQDRPGSSGLHCAYPTSPSGPQHACRHTRGCAASSAMCVTGRGSTISASATFLADSLQAGSPSIQPTRKSSTPAAGAGQRLAASARSPASLLSLAAAPASHGQPKPCRSPNRAPRTDKVCTRKHSSAGAVPRHGRVAATDAGGRAAAVPAAPHLCCPPCQATRHQTWQLSPALPAGRRPPATRRRLPRGGGGRDVTGCDPLTGSGSTPGPPHRGCQVSALLPCPVRLYT